MLLSLKSGTWEGELEGEGWNICDQVSILSQSKCLQILRLFMNKGKRGNRNI